MEKLNKYINQYLNHSYTIKEGYVITDDYESIYTIAEDISLCYNISYKQAMQYILEYYNYKFNIKYSDGYWNEYTYNSMGKELTYKTSNGYWHEWTYDHNGNELTCKDSEGYSFINWGKYIKYYYTFVYRKFKAFLRRFKTL